jgi:hypothetical protein
MVPEIKDRYPKTGDPVLDLDGIPTRRELNDLGLFQIISTKWFLLTGMDNPPEFEHIDSGDIRVELLPPFPGLFQIDMALRRGEMAKYHRLLKLYLMCFTDPKDPDAGPREDWGIDAEIQALPTDPRERHLAILAMSDRHMGNGKYGGDMARYGGFLPNLASIDAARESGDTKTYTMAARRFASNLWNPRDVDGPSPTFDLAAKLDMLPKEPKMRRKAIKEWTSKQRKQGYYGTHSWRRYYKHLWIPRVTRLWNRL